MKRCTKCGEAKELEDFSRDGKRSDGRQPHCKACHAAYRAANRDRINDQQMDYQRTYRAANRAGRREYNRAYRESNQDKVIQWRDANRLRQRDYSRDYRAANPHADWETNYRRRIAAYGFESVVKSFTRAELVDRHGDKCHHCGGAFEELDHWPVPVAHGGEHSLDNCVPSCSDCNRAPSASIRRARKAIDDPALLF